MRNTYRYGGKTERKESTWKTEAKENDNIKMRLKETGWEGMDWMNLAHDRDKYVAVVSGVMNLRVSQNAGNLLTS